VAAARALLAVSEVDAIDEGTTGPDQGRDRAA
jgi:hypothetical protein